MAETLDEAPDVSGFDAGFLVGILVGEGHFGGDGRQPQVTLRMHTDHEALFRWLVARVPGSRLYGLAATRPGTSFSGVATSIPASRARGTMS